MNRLLLVLPLLLCAFQQEPPKEPEPNEAEGLFRRMEEKLLTAKTVRFRVSSDVNDGKDGSLLGTVLIGEGNKVNWTTQVTMPKSKGTVRMVSDGGRLRHSSEGWGNPPQEGKAPSRWRECMILFVTRANLFMAPRLVKVNDVDRLDLQQYFKVSDFSFGEKERQGKSEIREVLYSIEVKGVDRVRTAVWVDMESLLPVRRRINSNAGAKPEMVVVEKYTDWVLDGPIDDKEFELPKGEEPAKK